MVVLSGKRAAETLTEDELEFKRMFFNIDDTVKESREFMSRLMYVSFSLLLKCRGILPEDAFKKGIIDGSVKSYVMNARNPIGLRVANKLRGACLALEDGHLERLVLLLTEDGSDTTKAVEAISWKISYDPDGITSLTLSSPEKDFCRLRYTGQDTVRDKTIAFLRLIQQICAQLHPVPDNVYASLRAMYTAAAPHGYQAEGFHDCPEVYRMHPHANRHCVPGVITKYNRCWLTVDSVFLEQTSRSPSVVSPGRNSIVFNSKNNTPAVETRYKLEKDFTQNDELEEVRATAPLTRNTKRATLMPIAENVSLEEFENVADLVVDFPTSPADDVNVQSALDINASIESPLVNNSSIENNSSISSPDAEQITSPTNPYSQSTGGTDTIDVTPKRIRNRDRHSGDDNDETSFVSEVSHQTPPRKILRVENNDGLRRRTPGKAHFLNGDEIIVVNEVRHQELRQNAPIENISGTRLRRTPGRARFLAEENNDVVIVHEVQRQSQETPQGVPAITKRQRRTPGRAKFLSK